MPTPATRVEANASVGFRDILSDDGTTVRAWTNDPQGLIDGPTVVLCNGLGTNPYVWPGLLTPDCGVRVISWFHRGIDGSERPADPAHVEIEHFVEDALSVMDHFGIDRSVLMGWSMGVNTMFELALRNPERVAGLFAVAGVPGDTFATMLGPLHLPHFVARQITVNACRIAKYGGWLVSPITRRLPITPGVIKAITRTGFMFPMPDPEMAAVGVKEFLTTPVEWYAHLAISTSRHSRVSLSQIQVPARFVAARWDLLAGARDMRTAAERMPEADYIEFSGSHFLPQERPEEIQALLLEFLEDVL
jgi:pimeloyl-ACP methyl ester carboxylesterase